LSKSITAFAQQSPTIFSPFVDIAPDTAHTGFGISKAVQHTCISYEPKQTPNSQLRNSSSPGQTDSPPFEKQETHGAIQFSFPSPNY
jgi:hypothetical protein